MTDGVQCQNTKGYTSESNALFAFTHAIMDNKVCARDPVPSARLQTSTILPLPVPAPSLTANPWLTRRAIPSSAWYLDYANVNPVLERPRWIVLFQASDVGVFASNKWEHAAAAIANVRGAIWRIFDDVVFANQAFEDGLADKFIDVVSAKEWESAS